MLGHLGGNADNNESLSGVNTSDQGFIEVFQIKSSGIIKYTKGGNAFSKTLTEKKM